MRIGPAAAEPSHRGLLGLLRDAGVTFWLSLSVRGLQFVIAVVLARMLGVDGFGVFGYAMGWIGLLSVLGGLGFVPLLVREVASLVARRHWALAHGLVRWAGIASLRNATLLASVAAVAGWVVGRNGDPRMLATFLLALPLIPVLVLVRTKQAMVRGLMRLGRGQVAEGLVLPATFLGLLTLMALDLVPRDPRSAMALQVVASLAALAWAASVLRASLPPEVRDAPAELARSHWWQASLTMFFITAVRVVNSKADVLLLGAFQGAESVGLYNAAARGAELTTLPVVVAGVILAPRFASLHARGAHDELWKLFWIGTAAMALSSAPLAGGLLLFGEQALGLFGPEFPAGNRVMTILVLGQWLTAATGPAGPMLVMTGRERITMGWVVGGTMLNVTLNLLLIPTWGAEGAALATATSMGVLNLGLLLHAWVRLAGHRREGRA